MKALQLLTIFFTLSFTACVKDKSSFEILENSRWKVSETISQKFDGTILSTTDDGDGGFYITFHANGTFERESYPYTVYSNGLWAYDDGEKKLVLTYVYDGGEEQTIEYTVLQLTSVKLVLYYDDYLESQSSFMNQTTVLKPYFD
jgi:hypothetical protein